MDNVRWKVIDPFKKEIRLSEYNFVHHIIEQHDPKDAEIRSKIEPQAKFAIEHPRFIIRDLQYSGRMKYLSLTDIKDKDRSLYQNDYGCCRIKRRSRNVVCSPHN